MFTIPIIASAAIIIWIIIIYNLFIRDKNHIKEAWSGIDVQLKRRHNLIPNLVASVRGYSKHERDLFEEITEKRAKSTKIENVKDKAAVEADLSGMIKNLFVVVEEYPDLKASQNFLDLQKIIPLTGNAATLSSSWPAARTVHLTPLSRLLSSP